MMVTVIIMKRERISSIAVNIMKWRATQKPILRETLRVACLMEFLRVIVQMA